jgi:hypothetical protein
MIGIRVLTVSLPSGDKQVPVTLAMPERSADDWVCKYQIDWPDRPKNLFARGYDALQAVHLAMQMIGADLYTSFYHEQGKLRWGKPGEGYGFPVTPSLRHLLVGEDRRFDA